MVGPRSDDSNCLPFDDIGPFDGTAQLLFKVRRDPAGPFERTKRIEGFQKRFFQWAGF